MKPKHRGGHPSPHTELCERVLVTLIRGLGPWRQAVSLVGGLVPRYLLGLPDPEQEIHAGTTDVDLVLSFSLLAEIDAYRCLEDTLKRMGFERGRNEEGQVRHFSWWRPVDATRTVGVDLLCDTEQVPGGRAVPLPRERRLSALETPGARLVELDHVIVPITAELLDEGGTATVEVRVAGIVAFLALKALAYEDRMEEKDAYDIVYCLLRHPGGPPGVARAFTAWRTAHPEDGFVPHSASWRTASPRMPGFRENARTAPAATPGSKRIRDAPERTCGRDGRRPPPWTPFLPPWSDPASRVLRKMLRMFRRTRGYLLWYT